MTQPSAIQRKPHHNQIHKAQQKPIPNGSGTLISNGSIWCFLHLLPCIFHAFVGWLAFSKWTWHLAIALQNAEALTKQVMCRLVWQWHFAAGPWIPRLFVGWCLGTGHFVAGGCLLYFGIIWKGACCYEARILYSSSFLPYEFWHGLTRRLYFKDLKLKMTVDVSQRVDYDKHSVDGWHGEYWVRTGFFATKWL